jgi:hypothetical protein
MSLIRYHDRNHAGNGRGGRVHDLATITRLFRCRSCIEDGKEGGLVIRHSALISFVECYDRCCDPLSLNLIAVAELQSAEKRELLSKPTPVPADTILNPVDETEETHWL